MYIATDSDAPLACATRGALRASATPRHAMGLKQKKAVAKKESGDLKVDKTSKAGYDRSNVAEVIKRLKQMAKEDTNRFDKMGLDETLERLEASERVAASVDAALAQESARKRALLSAFLERGETPPAPESADDETPTGNVSDNLAKASAESSAPLKTLETASDEDAIAVAKNRLAETQASSRRKLAAAKRARAHNEVMLAALDARGIAAPDEAKAGADM